MCTVPDTTTRLPRDVRGFTLIEVVIGLAILSLMAGAIYAITAGAVTSTLSLELTQSEDRRVEAFLQQTREALADLPETATLQLKLVENQPPSQELVLRNIPSAFIWGPQSQWEKAVVTVAPRVWEAGTAPPRSSAFLRGAGPLPPVRYALAFSVPDFYRTTAEGEPLPDSPLKSRQGTVDLRPDLQGRFWLDILPEIERAEWRFYDPAKRLWLDQAPASRPPLVELKLFLPGRSAPVREVFATF